MTCRLLVALALVGLPVAGCGKSEKDRYADDYAALNKRLLKLGEAVGRAPLEAGRETNATLTKRFGRYAADLAAVNREITRLDAPSELQDESAALTGSIGAVVRDLEAIAGAARRGDKQAASAATLALTGDSDKVNRAQNRLARATGAEVGPR